MKVKLYKRKKVDWYKAYLSQNNYDVFVKRHQLALLHPKWSLNRICYQALRSGYTANTLLRYRLTGKWSLDNV